MAEGSFNAEGFAKHLEDRSADAVARKVEVKKDEFKMVDLHPDKSDQKWTILGSNPSLPIDLEISGNPSPEAPLIALAGTSLDANILAFKLNGKGVQIKSLSSAQGVEIDILDQEGKVVQKVKLDPHGPLSDKRLNVDLNEENKALFRLGPEGFPIRVFKRPEDNGAVRLVINPPMQRR